MSVGKSALKQVDVDKLRSYVETNLRASNKAGLKFVDNSGIKERLSVRQNHIIFGRRGSGKSSLLTSLEPDGATTVIYLNIEDYKQVSFPNIITKGLIALVSGMNKSINGWSHPRMKLRLKKLLRELKKTLDSQDEKSTKIQSGVGAELRAMSVTAKADQNKTTEFLDSKLGGLELKVDRVKSAISDFCNVTKKDVLFLIDDFYFLKMEVQPEFLDYFHRLTKGTNMFLKVATIKHRSSIYSEKTGQPIGVQVGHDCLAINLDFQFSEYGKLQSFLELLLREACDGAGVDVRKDDIFTTEGFNGICIASGGVPRDFLVMLVELLPKVVSDKQQRISIVEVRDEAITKKSEKFESLQKDAPDKHTEIEKLVNGIVEFVYKEKRTNIFLVEKEETGENGKLLAFVRMLLDLRFVHLVDENISALPSDGKRYEAYMIDYSLYGNSRPRDFNELTPDTKDEIGRKDRIRSCPKATFQKLLN